MVTYYKKDKGDEEKITLARAEEEHELIRKKRFVTQYVLNRSLTSQYIMSGQATAKEGLLAFEFIEGISNND